MTSRISLSTASTRTLTEALLGLAGVVQRLRAFPADHPTLTSAVSGLERALEAVLAGRENVVIEVGTVQLLVDGMETNPDYEPLRDLAGQLREAGVGALELRSGITAAELLEALQSVAQGSVALLEASPHLRIRPAIGAGPSNADAWLALERLVLDDPSGARAEYGAEELALGLELLPARPERDSAILLHLAGIAGPTDAPPDPDPRLPGLIDRIPLSVLRRLLGPTAEPVPLREFAARAVRVLPPATLLRMLQALAPGREMLLSSAGLQVLARLVQRAEDSGLSVGRRALHEEVLRLAGVASEHPAGRPEPDRLLKLSLESGVLERGTLGAADRMIARRQVAPFLALLDTVPREDPVARALRTRLFHPQTVRLLLTASPVDLDALDRLIPATGIEAAPSLLDALAESRERRVRLRLLDLLARYGEAVGPLVVDRLEGMPWYVQRNLLALLGRLPDLPLTFDPAVMLGHRDARVRHEALALALTDPALRERSLIDALESPHDPTLRLGLATAAARCSLELAPRLMALVGDIDLDPDLRALAVTALAQVHDPVILRLLRRMVMARGIAGLGRLAPKTPPMLAALRGLSAHWGSHPKVLSLLETARQSRDSDIRDAARSSFRRSGPAGIRTAD